MCLLSLVHTLLVPSLVLDTFDQVIRQNRETYHWVATNKHTLERRWLIKIVLHTLYSVEGLVFYERRLDPNNNPQWVPSSDERTRRAVVEALEVGLVHSVTTGVKELSLETERHNVLASL